MCAKGSNGVDLVAVFYHPRHVRFRQKLFVRLPLDAVQSLVKKRLGQKALGFLGFAFGVSHAAPCMTLARYRIA